MSWYRDLEEHAADIVSQMSNDDRAKFIDRWDEWGRG